MTESLLERAQRILDGLPVGDTLATGVWVCAVVGVCTCGGHHLYGHEDGCGLEPLFECRTSSEAASIAASRTLIAELTEALRAAQERVVELEDHDVCCEWCGGGCSRERRWAERVEGS